MHTSLTVASHNLQYSYYTVTTPKHPLFTQQITLSKFIKIFNENFFINMQANFPPKYAHPLSSLISLFMTGISPRSVPLYTRRFIVHSQWHFASTATNPQGVWIFIQKLHILQYFIIYIVIISTPNATFPCSQQIAVP